MISRIALALLLAAASLPAQGVRPEIRARLDAVVKAFSSGSPPIFEAMAQASFAPELLARRTAEERKRLLAQVHGELGELEAVDEDAAAPGRFEIRPSRVQGRAPRH